MHKWVNEKVKKWRQTPNNFQWVESEIFMHEDILDEHTLISSPQNLKKKQKICEIAVNSNESALKNV